MEEILASIRRIIAEEPAAPKTPRDLQAPASGVLPPNPLFEAASRAPFASDRPTPDRVANETEASIGRVVEALDRAASEPVPASAEAKSSIDDVLAELLGERANAPVMNGASGAPTASTGSENADAAWRALEDKMGTKLEVQSEQSAPPANTGASSAEMSAPSAPIDVRPAPFFPSMRSSKTGFYPPQGAHLAKPIITAPEQPAASPAPAAELSVPLATRAAFEATAAAPTGSPLDAAASQPSVPLPPRSISMEVMPASTFPPFATHAPMTAPGAPMAQAAVMPVAAPPVSAAPQGAAAAVPSTPRPSPSPQAGPDSEWARAVAPAAAAPAATAAPVRSLEDAVADMMKPLLQQWLADNMPRIIEKALRVETARALRDNPKV